MYLKIKLLQKVLCLVKIDWLLETFSLRYLIEIKKEEYLLRKIKKE